MTKYQRHGLYYGMLNKVEKRIYDSMIEAFSEYTSFFTVPKCEFDTIRDVYEKVLLDSPEIFYMKNIDIEFLPITKEYKIMPAYRFTKEEVNLVNIEIERKIEPFLLQSIDKSEIEKEQLIHDYIISIVTYKDADAPYSHEMPGVLLYGIGVCEGISKAFKYLCDKMGLCAGIVVGNTKREPGAHAWNLICMNNKWYNVDVTFDANISEQAGVNRYDYFNVTDRELPNRKSFYDIPSCKTYYGFYEKIHKFAFSQKELKRMVKMSREGDYISVKLPRLNCSKEQLQEYLLKTIAGCLYGLGRYEINIYPNFDMNVFTIRVAKYRI